jgi:hypothetical protein
VLRLSLLYALLDRSPAITAAHLTAALAVWDYGEASARYVFGDATGDPVADRILAGLREDGTDDPERPGRPVHAQRLRESPGAALGLLRRAGLVAGEREATGGRPRAVWRAA